MMTKLKYLCMVPVVFFALIAFGLLLLVLWLCGVRYVGREDGEALDHLRWFDYGSTLDN